MSVSAVVFLVFVICVFGALYVRRGSKTQISSGKVIDFLTGGGRKDDEGMK
jgi:hypothetical protein